MPRWWVEARFIKVIISTGSYKLPGDDSCDSGIGSFFFRTFGEDGQIIDLTSESQGWGLESGDYTLFCLHHFCHPRFGPTFSCLGHKIILQLWCCVGIVFFFARYEPNSGGTWAGPKTNFLPRLPMADDTRIYQPKIFWYQPFKQKLTILYSNFDTTAKTTSLTNINL